MANKEKNFYTNLTQTYNIKSILKFKNTPYKSIKLNYIKSIIILNPTRAKKLFHINNINNSLYKFLTIYLGNDIQLKESDSFFHKEMKKNLRSAFNYYNYIVQHSRALDAFVELNKYFKFKNLIGIKKRDSSFPLYIDNIELTTNILKPVTFSKKVSVIMTVHNGGILLFYALKSLFKQTYQNLNVIVVDDASTDSTSEKLLEAKNIYTDRLKIITLKENLGTYVAKNIGLTYADGDLITFHDADDWAHPQRIEEHVKAHKLAKGTKASISQLVRIKPDGIFFSKHIYPLDRLCMISLMIDHSLINEIGYFRTYRIGSDSEYFERIKRFGKGKFIKINKVLTFCAHHSNSLTTNIKTGVSSFGINAKRAHYTKRYSNWHNMIKKTRKTPFIDFNRNKYTYEIID